MPGTDTPIVPGAASPNAVLGIMVGKLSTPIIGGLVGAGVLAAIMSSLDSQFVSVGTMFTRDIVAHGFGKDRFSDGQMVWLARGFITSIVIITFLFIQLIFHVILLHLVIEYHPLSIYKRQTNKPYQQR